MSLIEIIFRAMSSGSGSLTTIVPSSRLGAITVAKFSMKAVGRTIVARRPESLRYSSIRCFESWWGTPVSRSAPKTELNTTCGTRAAAAASTRAVPTRTSSSTSSRLFASGVMK